MAAVARTRTRMSQLCKANQSLLKRDRPRTYPERKINLLKEIRSTFETNSKVLIFHFNALSPDEWLDIRHDMRRERIEIKKYPNKLAKKSLEDTVYTNLQCLFESYTAVAFCNSDTVNLKNIVKIFNSTPKVELIGGKIDNTLMNKLQIEQYSKLPSLEQLHGELVSLLSMPGQQLLRSLQTNQSNLSMSLEQYIKQNDENL